MAALSIFAQAGSGEVDMTRWRPLAPGDVFKNIDGSISYVEYVNTSGAYVTPLRVGTSVANDDDFVAKGRSISANSVVQIIHPLELGGNSQEYRRYVKLELKFGRKGHIGMNKGAALGDFDDAPLSEINDHVGAEHPYVGKNGNTKQAKAEKRAADMAKKAAAKAAKAAARAAKPKVEKPPKTVRACTCGCGTETTGRFAPGHDARFHGWLTKLADGRIDGKGKLVTTGESTIPAAVLKKLGLVAKGDGFKATTPEYYKSEK